MIGDLSKSFENKIIDVKPRIIDFAVLAFGIIGLWLAMSQNQNTVLVYVNRYGDYEWMLLGAFSGIAATLVICKYLYKILSGRNNLVYNLVMWVGCNSLVLFPVHLEIKNTIGRLLNHYGFSYWWLLFAVMLLVGLPICNVIARHLFWALGRSNK